MIKTGEAYEGFGKILHMFRHYRLEYQKLDFVLIMDASIWYDRMQMAFETTILRNAQKLILIGFAKNADGAKTMWSDIYPALTYPGFKRIFFSYRYWWFAAKPRSRGASRRALSNREHDLFHFRYFENGPLEPEYHLPYFCWFETHYLKVQFCRSILLQVCAV